MSGVVLECIGRKSAHTPAYAESAWWDRDSFETLDQARSYAAYKSRQYPATPYRIVKVRRRAYPFVVRFIPSWKLKDGAA